MTSWDTCDQKKGIVMRTTFPSLQLLAPVTATVDTDTLAQIHLADTFALPASYRAFAATYGYGLLCNLLILFVPIPECGEDDLMWRSPALSAFFHEGIDEEWFEYEPDGSPELVGRLIPFGISENGHFLAWNPDEPTGPDEAMIYVVGPKFLAVWRAAPTLYDFVAMCLDERVKGVLGIGYTPKPATFKPITPYGRAR